LSLSIIDYISYLKLDLKIDSHKQIYQSIQTENIFNQNKFYQNQFSPPYHQRDALSLHYKTPTYSLHIFIDKYVT